MKALISTEDRGEGGEDRGGGQQTLRQRVHPVKVDEKYNLDDPVDGPHGKVGDEGHPLPVMSQDHHWVGQPFVLQHSHQPEGEEYRAGNTVHVS